ncbi:MFS transporter, partial [Bacillus sp. SIMBA_069]
NQSTMQLSMAAGAGIGGLAVDRISLSSITWFGTIGVAIAVAASLLLFSWIRQEARKKGMLQEHTLSD